MSTPQKKYYENNKAEVLAYKKQQYQQKKKYYIALKNLHINGHKKRDSDFFIKYGIEYNNLYFIINNDEGKVLNLEEFFNSYDIKGYCKVIGHFEAELNGIALHDLNIEDIIPHILDNKYQFILDIILPIVNKIK